MLNQFSSTELIFGKEAMEKLAFSRIAVFGRGAVGEAIKDLAAFNAPKIIDLNDKGNKQ